MCKSKMGAPEVEGRSAGAGSCCGEPRFEDTSRLSEDLARLIPSNSGEDAANEGGAKELAVVGMGGCVETGAGAGSSATPDLAIGSHERALAVGSACGVAAAADAGGAGLKKDLIDLCSGPGFASTPAIRRRSAMRVLQKAEWPVVVEPAAQTGH